MMGTTPVSATPESKGWSSLADNPTHGHMSAYSSPIILRKPPISSPANFKNHSTPQRIQVPTPNRAAGGITPSQHHERKLRSTVLSPYHAYHKSYTPLSATPSGASPAFKTPIRIATASSPHPMRTPVGTKIPTSSSKFITPQSGVVNPFEDALFDRYKGSVLSPGIFALTDTPESDAKSPKPFRWSIDQIAILNPAEIDEMPNQETFRARLNREVEERAQYAINEFFSRHNILPSPMNNIDGKPVYLATPIAQNGQQTGDLQGSVQKDLPRKKRTQEASCQTTLTLPTNFDLQKILGEFMTYNTEEEINQEVLSTSTLRRKLFFHGDTSVSPSPVKKADESIDMQCEYTSPPVSPLKPVSTPQWHRLSHQSSPVCFSSSPITVNKDPELCRRMSADMDCLQSPELSPIKNKQTPAQKNDPQNHQSLYGSFMSSPMLSKTGSQSANYLQRMAIASPEMSPICLRSKPVGFCIPDDMSPIHSPVQKERKLPSPTLSPIHQVESTDSPRGFTPSSDVHRQVLSPTLSTPSTVGTSKVSDGSVHVTGATLTTTPIITRDITMDPHQNCTDIVHLNNDVPQSMTTYQQRQQLSMSNISMDDTGMETEYAAHSTRIPLGTNHRDQEERNFSFSASRDCSMTYSESANQGSVGPVPTSQHSQDTGYQTCSLQLTNQDTGLQHTNLTSHFGSLPFRSDIEPDGKDESEEVCDTETLDLKQERVFHRPAIFKEKLDCVNMNFVNRQLNYHDSGRRLISKEKIGFLRTESDMKTVLEGCELLQDGLSEEQVKAKARLLLGQNHSLNSSISDGQVGSAFAQSQLAKSHPPGSGQMLPWQPSCSSTPQKSQQHMHEQFFQKSEPLPSEVALAVLRRAEDDLAKFGHM